MTIFLSSLVWIVFSSARLFILILFVQLSVLPVLAVHCSLFKIYSSLPCTKTAAIAKQRKQKIVKFSVWVKRFAICVWFANKSHIRIIIIIVVKFKRFQWNRVITIDRNHIFNWFRFVFVSCFSFSCRPKYRGSIWRPILSGIIFHAIYDFTDCITFSVFRRKLIWMISLTKY